MGGMPRGWGTKEDLRLVEVGKRFGVYVYGSGTADQLTAAQAFGIEIESRLQAVGGNSSWTLQQLEQAEKPKTVPESATIGFTAITENSVMVFWQANKDGGSPITGYHLVLKNEDTGQTIIELNPNPNTTDYFFHNLDSATNYKAYVMVINAIGNSFEQSNGFKTLGVITPTYNFIIEPDGKVRMFRIGAAQYTEIKALPEEVQSYIDRGVSRLLTAAERAIPYPRPEPEPITYCVNVYTLDTGGNVLSNHYDSINITKFQQLTNEGKYVFSCEDGIIPTEQQVRDHYGYTAPVADSSINTTMVSQLIGTFILKDGRVKGQIMYITNEAQYNNNNKLISGFNPFYYSKTKNLISLVQIKSKSGVPIVVKPNGLNFTQTEKDEIIHIDEAVGNFKELIVDFFVWKSTTDMRAFAENKQIQVVETPPDEPEPCEIGFHKDFSGKCVPDDPLPEIPRDKLIDTLKGFLFGTVALSLLARKY